MPADLPLYLPGDIVLCNFRRQETPSITEPRPGLILSFNDGIYKIAQITSTDRRNQLKGRWIDDKSEEGIKMKLKNPSFINLENVARISNMSKGIIRYLGHCPLMDELIQYAMDNGLGYLFE